MQHPFLSDDYHIRWSTLTPEHIEADIKQALELAEQRLDAIRNLPAEKVSYATTFEALEKAAEELERGWGRLSHLDSVDDNPEQRAAMNAMLPQVSAFYSQIALDSKIWASLKAFSESAEAKSLSSVKQRFIEETCADFIQSGANLDEDQKAEVAEIDAELSQKTKKFSENVLDSTNAWEAVIDDEARLAGLPEMAKESARLDALENDHGSEDKPKWRFTLQHPSMAPVMQHGGDDSLRKEIWLANCTVGRDGEYDNTDLIWEILDLRQQKAEILGQKSFPDLILQRRMAKTGKAALDFTEDLHGKIQQKFLQETQELQTIKRRKRVGLQRRSNHGKQATGLKNAGKNNTHSTTKRCGPISLSIVLWKECSPSLLSSSVLKSPKKKQSTEMMPRARFRFGTKNVNFTISRTLLLASCSAHSTPTGIRVRLSVVARG